MLRSGGTRFERVAGAAAGAGARREPERDGNGKERDAAIVCV